MKTRTWMLIGALLAIPALGWSDEPAKPGASPLSSPGAIPAVAAIRKVDQPALNLQTLEVQKIIRASANEQMAAAPPASGVLAPDQAPVATLAGEVTLPFRAPRRPHHLVCDSFNCVAYSADDVALYSVPREQYYGQNAPDNFTKDAWLSCQSHDNLLSTFERYDKCRGVAIGLPPVALGNTVIAVPGLTFPTRD
jgi:hypothetical protein